jgi:hypothetical protein
MLYQLSNVLAQNGRNFNVCLLVVLHQLNKGLQSTTLLREADGIVIFPKAYNVNTYNTLVNHFGMNKVIVKNLFDHKDEHFILIHLLWYINGESRSVKIIFYLCLNMSLYGYGELYGSGYRYPRRPRKAYIGKDQEKLWTRAAVFNTAIANKNPWVEYLRTHGVYDKIREELQKARAGYYKDRPYKTSSDVQRKISQLEKQLDTLREEYGVIEKTAPDLSDVYATTKVASKLPYAEAVDLTKGKFQNQIDSINNRIAELKAIKEQLLAAKK